MDPRKINKNFKELQTSLSTMNDYLKEIEKLLSILVHNTTTTTTTNSHSSWTPQPSSAETNIPIDIYFPTPRNNKL